MDLCVARLWPAHNAVDHAPKTKGNDEANQRQRLRESEAEEHVLANHAVGLRLAGDRLHTLAEE